MNGENLDDFYKREVEDEQQQLQRCKQGNWHAKDSEKNKDKNNNNKNSKIAKLPNDRARVRPKAATMAFQSKVYTIENNHCQDSLHSNHVWVQQVLQVLRLAKRYYWNKLELPKRWLETTPLFGSACNANNRPNSSNGNSSKSSEKRKVLQHGSVSKTQSSTIRPVVPWTGFGKLCDVSIVCENIVKCQMSK